MSYYSKMKKVLKVCKAAWLTRSINTAVEMMVIHDVLHLDKSFKAICSAVDEANKGTRKQVNLKIDYINYLIGTTKFNHFQRRCVLTKLADYSYSIKRERCLSLKMRSCRCWYGVFIKNLKSNAFI